MRLITEKRLKRWLRLGMMLIRKGVLKGMKRRRKRIRPRIGHIFEITIAHCQ
jgi:hypothetical protein